MPRLYNKGRDRNIPVSAVLIDRTTKWGNPYKMRNEKDRDYVCDMFEEKVLPWLNVSELKGKDLVCWCHPKRCHGLSIMKQANFSSHLLVLSVHLARSLSLVLSVRMARSLEVVLFTELARSRKVVLSSNLAHSHFMVLSTRMAHSLAMVLSATVARSRRLVLSKVYGSLNRVGSLRCCGSLRLLGSLV
jgi:hypothetical protein